METVLLAGASGGTGREALARLVDTDHRVRALTRSDAKAGRLEQAGADEVVAGDLLVAALHTPDAADRTLEVVWNPLVADRATADGGDIDWQHPERKP